MVTKWVEEEAADAATPDPVPAGSRVATAMRGYSRRATKTAAGLRALSARLKMTEPSPLDKVSVKTKTTPLSPTEFLLAEHLTEGANTTTMVPIVRTKAGLRKTAATILVPAPESSS
jgi:hypothetical protein